MSSHLNEGDLKELRTALLRKRSELRGVIDTHRDDSRAISNDEIEDGDAAERIIEQDEALRLSEHDAELVAEIDHALAKIAAGTYGVSEDSGAAIPVERLRAVPWARRTLDEERRHTPGPRGSRD